MKDYMVNLRSTNTIEPIPYSANLPPVAPRKELSLEDPGDHKKVTVVGCGQVGMAIAVSYMSLYNICTQSDCYLGN
jgi:hypothetical protein